MKFALLSDTHISGHSNLISHGHNPRTNLQLAVEEILQEHPNFVLINGDCAFRVGTELAYRKLEELLAPLSHAGIPIHRLMGNHDNPALIGKGVPAVRTIELPEVNLILLNTQMAMNIVPGKVGVQQLNEVERILQSLGEKPVLLFGHHNPEQPERRDYEHGVGIVDSDRFLEFLSRHPRIRTFIYGHTHSWHASQDNGTWLINLPACAFSFNPSRPGGWTLGSLEGEHLKLTLRPLDSSHPQAGETVTISLMD